MLRRTGAPPEPVIGLAFGETGWRTTPEMTAD
jgi:hypothetical protein